MSNSVLIVDDQVELTQILSEYFHIKKGYHILTATDGKAALGLIEEHKPQLVLLDMKLPSVNGLEILKVLRKNYPDCKVIVMTAYDAEYKKEIDLVGYDAFFIKPITFEELKDTVEALLTGKAVKQSEAKILSESISKEAVISPQDRKNLIPCARLVIIEIRGNIALLLKEYLQSLQANYSVLILKSGALYFEEVDKFKPDVVLYDIVQIGTFTEFATKLMNSAKPPKEIILFGDPKFKWEEVNLLVSRGMSYVSTPLGSYDKTLSNYSEFELPAKETVERLAGVIKEVCFKHGLIIKKGEGDA